MITPVDDLKIGDWVAVVANEADRCDHPRPFMGTPLQIKAFSLPFIATQIFKQMIILDTRVHRVTKLSRKYVNYTLRQIGNVAQASDCMAHVNRKPEGEAGVNYES